MKENILRATYTKFFNAGTAENQQKLNWENFHLLTQELIEDIIFSSAEDFHQLAVKDLKSELVMPPWIRLLGYKKATDEFPYSIQYLEGYLGTLNLYYSLQTELIGEIEQRIIEIKNK